MILELKSRNALPRFHRLGAR